MLSPRFSPPATSGSYKSAGLPNIEGQINIRKVNSTNYIVWNIDGGKNGYGNVNGALGARKGTGSFLAIVGATSTTVVTPDNIFFNASNSNSIYGSSTTVQPNSFTVRYIIKY